MFEISPDGSPRDDSRGSSSSETRRMPNPLYTTIDIPSDRVAFYIDDGRSSPIRGISEFRRNSAIPIPIVHISSEFMTDGSFDDINFTRSSSLLAKDLSKHRRQSGSRKSQVSSCSMYSNASSRRRLSSTGEYHVRRHSERLCHPKRNSIRRSNSEVRCSMRRSIPSSRRMSTEPLKAKKMTPEEEEKEKRRRRIVMIIMITFFWILVASVLIVVVTLTHSSYANVDNSTRQVYTFSQPSQHVILEQYQIRQENERLQELQNQAAIFTPNSTSHSTLDTETSNSSAITK